MKLINLLSDELREWLKNNYLTERECSARLQTSRKEL